MAPRVYADQAAYVAYHGGTAPAQVDRLLRMASRVVDSILVGRVYDTDPDGYPTDVDVAQALSDATCAIAGEADARGLAVAGSTEDWQAASIGGVSLTRGSGTGVETVQGVPVPPDALLALQSVGYQLVVAP